MLTLIATSALVGLIGIAIGFLVRKRWWPMTWQSASLAEGEWRVLACGGFPYVSVSVMGRFAVTPLALAELAKTVQAGQYVGPQTLPKKVA